MKFLLGICALFMLTTSVQADTSCNASCFEAKKKCNALHAHTINGCDESLFSCKASCNSGKKAEIYSTRLPIDFHFQPILALE